MYEFRIPIRKADTLKGLITGAASIATDANGDPVVDHDGDIIPIEELEKAVAEAMQATGGSGQVGDMHERQGVGDVVESMVLTREKRQALGLGDGPEFWAVTLKIHDKALLKEIAKGRKLELSINGFAERVPVDA